MPSESLRVLIVDDSPDDAVLIRRALEREGFRVECVRVDTLRSVNAALRDDRSWDVIACDVQMPILDAAQVLAIARAALPDVPVVLVSGTYPQDLWHELGSGLAKRFISKNRLEDLAPTVKALLAQH